jgi:anaerobic magnesium-protoporphyrin IX monomethyl ester cyclase
MHIVLWDTRKLDVSKDFAGGFGVGQYHGRGGLLGQVVRHFYKRDHRPVALSFAYLAAIFRKLGHRVEYCEDALPRGADLYVFHPALITLNLERQVMIQVREESPKARILVTGIVGHVLPEAFRHLNVTIVKGECEQLLWKLDEVLASDKPVVEVGSVRNLDDLPLPDWSLFQPERFRIAYDFWMFPTGLVQQSRGCTFTCNYCPYIVVENATRFRSPESVVDEIRNGMHRYGFRSFKFRDPLFGLDRKRALRVAELIGQLPRKIQFSIETRIDLMRPETLKALHDVGLTSITVGIETPDEDTLRHHKRAPIKDDRQREFVALCRRMGIRTVAGFMVGFPHDTARSIRHVLKYAKAVGPTFANFNVVTPYPGTEFFEQIKEEIANFDYTQYSVYTPVMRYKHLTADEVGQLHAKCFTRYYFRWQYLQENAHLLWPLLQKLPPWRRRDALVEADQGHIGPPKPKSGLEILQQSPGLRKDGPHLWTPSHERSDAHPPRRAM